MPKIRELETKLDEERCIQNSFLLNIMHEKHVKDCQTVNFNLGKRGEIEFKNKYLQIKKLLQLEQRLIKKYFSQRCDWFRWRPSRKGRSVEGHSNFQCPCKQLTITYQDSKLLL